MIKTVACFQPIKTNFINKVHPRGELDFKNFSLGFKIKRASAKFNMAKSLATLVKSGVLQAGKDVMTRDYLGTRYTADLLSDGKILWKDQDAKENIFNTPSAFSTMVMRFVLRIPANKACFLQIPDNIVAH